MNRLRARLGGYVERGEVPGVVALVARGGETQVEVLGTQTFGGAPMRRDSLFRITSMTKPVAAAAAMMLVEACQLRLDDPVDGLLPELGNRTVLRRVDGPLDDVVPAARRITLRDLLTFQMGFGFMLPMDTYPIQKAVADLGLAAIGPPKPASPLEPDEWMRRLGRLPLMSQPGQRWMYNTGSSVLGVLLARASGQPLEQLLYERIFEPLGMRDTSFSVSPSDLGRLVSCYSMENGKPALHDGVADSQWSHPPSFPDAAAGLISTVDDYHAFGAMLLNGGRFGSQHLLSRASVDMMTTDHISPQQKALSNDFPDFWVGRGWGFGLSIALHRQHLWTTPGQFGWDGGYGTTWRSDPQTGVVGIMLSQVTGPPWSSPLHHDFWTTVYAGLD